MRDGVYTRFTSKCVKCGALLPYPLPVDEHGPRCDECERPEPDERAIAETRDNFEVPK